ncbi:hypothetical protein Gotri_010546 [Gossypium trilobum]|uniref:Uncharacterized protein n=1 Tax=Gossypium trilobum TaxID=34281 RepID=A0A7J9ESE1_9ROSI|nr:hypothetical protein [Gossypium trilobum]
MSLNLTGTPFYYLDFDNVFWSSGCGNLVTVFDNEKGNLVGGCLQPSCRKSKETSSTTGCPINIPQGLGSFSSNMSGSQKRSCGFASLVKSDLYFDLTLESNDFNVNNWTYVPTSLQWSTPISGLCHLRQGLNTTCSFDREYCWQSLSSTHLCVCNKDFSIGGFSTFCEDENSEMIKNLIKLFQKRLKEVATEPAALGQDLFSHLAQREKEIQNLKEQIKYLKENGKLPPPQPARNGIELFPSIRQLDKLRSSGTEKFIFPSPEEKKKPSTYDLYLQIKAQKEEEKRKAAEEKRKKEKALGKRPMEKQQDEEESKFSSPSSSPPRHVKILDDAKRRTIF